jgi:ADP-heptose:LPS heptosyltransferase
MTKLRIIKRKVTDAIRFGIDEVLSRTPFNPDPHKVLFIRLDGIGDFVVWIDAARALAQHYRNQAKSPILLADSNCAGLAEALGIFDQVIRFDEPRFSSRPLYRIQMARRIRGLGCTLAIQPTYSRAFETGDAVIHFCGAKQRIGSTGNPTMTTEARKRISDRWYTQLIPASEGPRMELIRNAEFVRSLLGIDFKAKVPDLALVASSWAKPQCAAEIGDGEPFYILFPGASFPGRRWPLASFRQVAEFLHRETGWRGVVCGGPGDAHLAASLCQESSAPLLNWSGRTTLSELAVIFLRAKLLRANETSAVHLAEAVKLPTVCILGGGHFGRFVPYTVEEDAKRPLMQTAMHKMECFGCDWRCIYKVPADKPQPCIEGIGVDDVCQMIRRILSNSSSYVAAATGQQFAQSAKHN